MKYLISQNIGGDSCAICQVVTEVESIHGMLVEDVNSLEEDIWSFVPVQRDSYLTRYFSGRSFESIYHFISELETYEWVTSPVEYDEELFFSCLTNSA